MLSQTTAAVPQLALKRVIANGILRDKTFKTKHLKIWMQLWFYLSWNNYIAFDFDNLVEEMNIDKKTLLEAFEDLTARGLLEIGPTLLGAPSYRLGIDYRMPITQKLRLVSSKK